MWLLWPRGLGPAATEEPVCPDIGALSVSSLGCFVDLTLFQVDCQHLSAQGSTLRASQGLGERVARAP